MARKHLYLLGYLWVRNCGYGSRLLIIHFEEATTTAFGALEGPLGPTVCNATGLQEYKAIVGPTVF